MLIFSRISEITDYLSAIKLKNSSFSIGFVPTMGALHKGHSSLIERSVNENSVTVCSIYVNSLQFNDLNDYNKYPQTFDSDIKMLQKAGCNVVFAPKQEEMLPEDAVPDYDLNGLDKVMEGKFRPGHFKGVVYIVKKFFEIIKPDRAYFGIKDFQQLQIIKYIVKSLQIKGFGSKLIEIMECPIKRDFDGLALSSRNMRLTEEQRITAPVIYRTLKYVKEKYKELSLADLRDKVKSRIEKNNKMKLEYFEVVDMQTLLPVSTIRPHETIACIAVHLDEIRLIDNIILF